MKKTILLCGTVWLLFVACKVQDKVDYALISGQILNHTGEAIIMSKDMTFVQVIKFTCEGKFSDTLRIPSGIYSFYIDKNVKDIYIANGHNLIINADANNFKNTLVFSGKGSGANAYLLVKEKAETRLKDEGTSIYDLSEENYKARLNDHKKTLIDALDNSESVQKDYRKNEKRNLHYEYLFKLGSYEQQHAGAIKKPGFKVSKDFLSEMNDVNFESEEDYAFSPAYRIMLSRHYEQRAKNLVKAEGITKDIARLKVYQTISNENLKNELLFENTHKTITNTPDIEELYSGFTAASTNDENNTKITEIYNRLTLIAKGQPSPKFVNYVNKDGGTTSLDDLKGRFVYIDIWATWCGPCMAEIPIFEEIERSYHGKNIKFVSISVDKQKDHGKWKKMIGDKQMDGMQLLADNELKSQFIQDYSISSIPRFILIDPDGKIVSANAPRPSENEKLEVLFSSLNL